MTRFTDGHISVTPIRVTIDATLEDISNAVANRRYESVGEPGWGSFTDGTELVNQPTRERPPVGRPRVLSARAEIPQRLAARFYYDEVDRKRSRLASDGADLSDFMVLQTADLLLSETHGGVFLGLAGVALGSNAASKLKESLEDSLGGLAPVTVEIDQSELHLGDVDIFRWLLYRWKTDKDLGSIKLQGFEAIDSGESSGGRRSSLTGGAEFDRPELLALLSGIGTRFGPARIELHYPELDMAVELLLRVNGGFQLIMKNSGYKDEDPYTKEELTRSLVEDSAYRVLPDLKSAYAADKKWGGARPKFLDESRRDLVKAVAASIEDKNCPACGAPRKQ